MPFLAVIFSAQAIRGSLLSKALEKNDFEVSLNKNLYAAGDVLKTKAPQIVILDTEGYFPGELESFSLLSGLLKGTPVIIVSNSVSNSSITLKDVSVEWCQSNPLDLTAIVVKSRIMLPASPKETPNERGEETGKEKEPEKEQDKYPNKEKIAEDLMGFLGFK